uniref:Uncharacterized protein n=1 Tax=Anguilla anguilla TaxID=7936 RepID=A0A0E9XTW7_ANGAN
MRHPPPPPPSPILLKAASSLKYRNIPPTHMPSAATFIPPTTHYNGEHTVRCSDVTSLWLASSEY